MRPFLLALTPLGLLFAFGCTDSAVQDPPAGTDLGTEIDTAEETVQIEDAEHSPTQDAVPDSLSSGGGTAMKFAPKDDSAEAAVKAMINGVSQGHPEILWDAMPVGYQNDINDVVQTFGRNMDPQAWKQILDVFGTLHSIIDTKAEFILNNEIVKAAPNAEEIEQALPQVAGLLRSVIDIADLDSLATFDGQKFLTGPGANLLTQADVMARLSDDSPSLLDLATAKVRTVSTNGDSATLEITSPKGDKEESEWVRVDSHWLPAEMASDWDESMQTAREQLATLPETMKQAAPQIALFAGMANGALMQIQAAEDQAQFDQAIGGILQQFGAMVPMGALGGPSMELGEDDFEFDSPDSESDEDFRLDEEPPAETE